jgi:cytidylate kinase
MDNFVITIGRNCGSGGGTVASMLGERLGVMVYDKNLLRKASDNSGINEELFELADEHLKNSLLFRVSRSACDGGHAPVESGNLTADKNLFDYQARVIKGIADSSSCIIVGRCADWVLRDRYNTLRVFIGASRESCADREAKRKSIPVNEARSRITETDRQRGEYYRFYTGQNWAEPRQYDICLNTDVYTYEQCVDIIIDALKVKLG